MAIRPRYPGDIPAPTGEPGWDAIIRAHMEGHPRTYGGTEPVRSAFAAETGTSPHLRGNPISNHPPSRKSGDIPAPTGEPRIGKDRPVEPEGHPRTYGGTALAAQQADSVLGTSPHLRGNPLRSPYRHRPARDIPAPTGEPIRPGVPVHGREGHPRTYGGTMSLARASASAAGTSPHLRGNQTSKWLAPCKTRDIPAPTGEPGRRSSRGRDQPGHPRTYGGTPGADRTRK